MSECVCIIPFLIDPENETVSLHMVAAKDVAIHVGESYTYVFWSMGVSVRSRNELRGTKEETVFMNVLVDPEIADIEFHYDSVAGYNAMKELKEKLSKDGRLAEIPHRP